MTPRVKLKWNDKEKDWQFNYPDNAGKSLMGPFFQMTLTTGHRTDWKKELKTMLEEAGYDYKTLTITCKKKKS